MIIRVLSFILNFSSLNRILLLIYSIVLTKLASTDGSPGDVGEEHAMYVKRRKGCGMSCDVGEATKGLENEATK